MEYSEAWNLMIKKSRVLKDELVWDLIDLFCSDYGYPVYREELVIYIDEPKPIRITLTNQEISWRWTEAKKLERYHRLKRILISPPRNIRDKLWFLTKHYGNKGKINAGALFTFPTTTIGTRLEIRPASFVGPILSITYPDDFFENEERRRRNDAFLEKMQPFIREGELLKRTRAKALEIKDEPLLTFGVADEPILNARIFEFCKNNGIMHMTKRHYTYRNLLQARENDYSCYEDLFKKLMGIPLLSFDKHVAIDEFRDANVSVIIPCFNTNDTICLVLHSISRQVLHEETMRRMEVVLIDDSSDIPVAEVVDQSQYPFFR